MNAPLPELIPGTTLSMPEAFLLLCLKEKEGTLLADTVRAQHGLAGAILAELALAGAVHILADEDADEAAENPGAGEQQAQPRTGTNPGTHAGTHASTYRERIFRLRRTSTGHDVNAVFVHVNPDFVVDEATDTYGEPLSDVCGNALTKIRRSRHLQTATDWVSDLAPAGLRHLIAEPLISAGVLDRRKRRLWGFIPLTSYPEIRPEVENNLREHLSQRISLAHDGTAAATLLGLLQATGLTRKVLGAETDQDRVSQIVASAALPEAVQEAVQAAYFATVSSVAATGTDLS